jgi:hypothetical protein
MVSRMVVSRVAGASVRAGVMASLVAAPQLALGAAAPEGAQLVALFALLAAGFTFSEYASAAPSLVEFRDAAPYNRFKVVALFAMVLLAALMLRGDEDRATLSLLLRAIGDRLGAALDFPGSPVRLAVLALAPDAAEAAARSLRAAAASTLAVGVLAVAGFGVVVRLRGWLERQDFNVWVNLPQFDPTAGGDVVERLLREAHVNLALGITLPFFLPMVAGLLGLGAVAGPATLVWMVAAWAFIPASLAMRALALIRVAQRIAAARARASEEDGAAWQAA